MPQGLKAIGGIPPLTKLHYETERDMTINATSFIENYDFSNVVSRAINGGFDPEFAPDALKELKAFFVACAKKEMVLSPPSVECDELWHEFITHTRAYAAFCDKAFGEFLHHDADISPELLAECQENALKVFGESVFANKAACGEISRKSACGEIRLKAACGEISRKVACGEIGRVAA